MKEKKKILFVPDVNVRIASMQIERLYEQIRSYIYYKLTRDKLQFIRIDVKNFLIHANSLYFKSFILEWCILFGGCKNDKINFRLSSPLPDSEKLSIEEKGKKVIKVFTQDCLNFIFQHAMCDEDEFYETSDNMRKFRGKYIAHYDLNIPKAPVLDLPFRITSAYYEWLNNSLDPIGGGRPLHELKQEFSIEAENALSHLPLSPSRA